MPWSTIPVGNAGLIRRETLDELIAATEEKMLLPIDTAYHTYLPEAYGNGELLEYFKTIPYQFTINTLPPATSVTICGFFGEKEGTGENTLFNTLTWEEAFANAGLDNIFPGFSKMPSWGRPFWREILNEPRTVLDYLGEQFFRPHNDPPEESDIRSATGTESENADEDTSWDEAKDNGWAAVALDTPSPGSSLAVGHAGVGELTQVPGATYKHEVTVSFFDNAILTIDTSRLDGYTLTDGWIVGHYTGPDDDADYTDDIDIDVDYEGENLVTALTLTVADQKVWKAYQISNIDTETNKTGDTEVTITANDPGDDIGDRDETWPKPAVLNTPETWSRRAFVELEGTSTPPGISYIRGLHVQIDFEYKTAV